MTGQGRFAFIVLAATAVSFAAWLQPLRASAAEQNPPPPPSIRDLVEQAKPSVVGIDAYQTVPYGLYVHSRDFVIPFPFTTWPGRILRFIFYIPRAIVYPFSSHRQATGFFVNDRGHVVTSYHVVEDYNVVYVSLFDGSVIEAKVIGKDMFADIALLEIDAEQVPKVVKPAEFGDSDALRPGDWVMVIGNPLGLNYTVTSGIVSGTARQIDVTPLDDLIQIDAALDPGNSGGPVFDSKGMVVGVAEANIFLAQNKGFAVPANMARAVLPDLKTIGEPRRGRIGIRVEDPTYLFAAARGLDKPTGSRVVFVEAKSPADAAGILRDDLITGYGERRVENSVEFVRMVRDTAPGTIVAIEILRTGPPTQPGTCRKPVCTTIKVRTDIIKKRFSVF